MTRGSAGGGWSAGIAVGNALALLTALLALASCGLALGLDPTDGLQFTGDSADAPGDGGPDALTFGDLEPPTAGWDAGVTLSGVQPSDLVVIVLAYSGASSASAPVVTGLEVTETSSPCTNGDNGLYVEYGYGGSGTVSASPGEPSAPLTSLFAARYESMMALVGPGPACNSGVADGASLISGPIVQSDARAPLVVGAFVLESVSGNAGVTVMTDTWSEQAISTGPLPAVYESQNSIQGPSYSAQIGVEGPSKGWVGMTLVLAN